MYLFVFLTLIINVFSIGVPLHEGPRCMIISGQLDPIKLQIKLPAIPNKRQGQKFQVTFLQFVSDSTIFNVLLQEKTIYRKNLELPYNKLYHLCIEVYTSRNSFNPETEKMYVEYTVHQNFDALIGNIEIPQQLLGEKNLQYIYNVSAAISNLNNKIIENQKRERQIQQKMTESNLNKNHKISMFMIIECIVIVISGLYQVLALRRFLIQKNLY